MADTFAVDTDHLQNLKTLIVNLTSDLIGDPEIAALQEWGTTTLWAPSTWSAKIGTGSSPGGGTGAPLTLLPGNQDNLPAAKLLAQRATGYASAVIDAVNWAYDVLTNLSANIDYTIKKVDSAEHDNVLTVDQAMTDFNQTIAGLGGAPTPTTNGPTITVK